MGSVPPKASEPEQTAQPYEYGTADAKMMDACPSAKQADEPVPQPNSNSAPSTRHTNTNGETLTSNNQSTHAGVNINGGALAAPARGAPLANEGMDTQLRPAKKQKQEGSAASMDVSPDTSSDTTSTSNGSILVVQPPVSVSAPPLASAPIPVKTPMADANAPVSTPAATPVPTAAADSNAAPSSVIHPSIAEIIKLEEIPTSVEHLECLSLRDMAELESSLQIGDTYSYNDDDGWKPDWGGNLLLYEKNVIVNKGYLASQPNAKPVHVKYCDWVASQASYNKLRGLELLLRFVFNMKDTPAAAKKILAHALHRPAESAEQRLQFIIDATQRVSYDPAVLQQDGWTTEKVDSPEKGEAFHIGRRIMWQRHEAIIVAYTPDETYGGLWKGVYTEDLETFDLEPGELQSGIKKWDNKQKQLLKQKTTRATPPMGSTRFAATKNFTVDGIEHGIVLAVPTARAAQGVLWPARVRHVVEGTSIATGKRTSAKNIIQVVFLAPFWNGQVLGNKASDASKDPYSLGPLFEFDNIEINEYTVQKYPFEKVSVENVQGSFRFLGLPNAVFARYLDSHRLAVALKIYAIKHISIDTRSEDQIHASASLTESHACSVRTAIFPQVALTVPFDYILSKLPHPLELASAMSTDGDDADVEPTIDIQAIIHAMDPPSCFGMRKPSTPQFGESLLTPECPKSALLQSPNPTFTPAVQVTSSQLEKDDETLWSMEKFASDFLCGLFKSQPAGDDLAIDGLPYMSKMLFALIAKLRQLSGDYTGYEANQQKAELRNILLQCMLIKSNGEEALESGRLPLGVSKSTIVTEWRKACERLYKRTIGKLSSAGVGNNITAVLTDSRCNGHITPGGSFERAVRIPAAIKGAKLAGAGKDPNIQLVTQVEDSYLTIAENKIIPQAHKIPYIRRLKNKISSIPPDKIGVPLTDDSDGEGGEDTMGSRGSYTAAIVGVAAALKAADMVVGGQCVNTFCAVRPPGHHAGRELRSMNAISNGFCLFNAAACAAIYATTPRSQGGLGLKRVCVIDFDVHHGNGTQDVLCPTHDPRFLYVSLHAGGAHINGYDDEDAEEESFRLRLGGKKQDGIFPGRCGDSSPHEGVLNIPLGQKVTASAMGAALVSQVTPKVEAFSPDLIILSAGFDAHVNDPLGMGGLTAEDFGSVTEVACQIAYKTCSGRIFSILEGGYGVPCCQPRDDLFLPPNSGEEKLLDLGSDMPPTMKDEVPFTLRQKLDKCHNEGFLHCVKNHVQGLINSNKRK